MKKIRLLAIIAALITVIMTYFYLGNLKEEAQVPKASVVLSTVDITMNTQITQEMVKLVELPQEAVGPGALTEVSQAVGKIATSDIFIGQQIVEPQLAEPGASTKELSYMIEQGKKAVAIKVDEVSSVAGLIEPGNKVDVVVVYEESGESEVVLSNITVLSTGKRMTPGKSATVEDVYETVSLSLNATETLKLRKAEAKGSITMALRSYLDK